MSIYNHSLKQLGTCPFNILPKVVLAIISLQLGFWIISKISGVLEEVLSTSGTDKSIAKFLSSSANVTMKVIELLVAASMFAVNTTSFVAI